MATAGYETALFGKTHFSTYHTYEPAGTPECLRSSAQYDDTWYGPYMGFQHVEMMLVGHNWWAPEKPPAGQHYERFYHMDGRGDECTKLMWENAGDTKGAAQVWHSRLPLAYHNTPWTADRAIEWIKHGRDTDKPFCTWVSYPDPHHPFDCPEPWSWLHKPEEVDLPPNRTRNYEGLLRVPMIVRGLNVRAGAVIDQPNSTLDLGPTFYDYGAAEALQTQHGMSLLPLFETDDATRDFALNEWGLLPGRVGVALELRTVRTRTHKMTIDLNSGAGELYNLVQDPHEQTNLFDDPVHAEVQAELLSYTNTRPDDMRPDAVPVGTA